MNGYNRTSSATITITNATPQLSASSPSSAGAGVGELLGSSHLRTGTLGVAITLPQGPETTAEAAAIRNAIASLNSQVAPLGITLVEVSGADAAEAPVHITLASTSSIGGLDEGVLGAFTAGGDITLVSGWNWYLGSDPAEISQDQYDFQTVVTHELGHALGLGENSDPGSVMDLHLNPGQANRNLTANDLDAIRQELPASPAPLPVSVEPGVSNSLPLPLVVPPESDAAAAVRLVNSQVSVEDDTQESAAGGTPFGVFNVTLSQALGNLSGKTLQTVSETPIVLIDTPSVAFVPGVVTGTLRPDMPADGDSDVLVGGAGGDLLLGGEGSDLLVGGFGENRQTGIASAPISPELIAGGDRIQAPRAVSAVASPLVDQLSGVPTASEDTTGRLDDAFFAAPTASTGGGELVGSGRLDSILYDRLGDGLAADGALAPVLVGLAFIGWSGPSRERSRHVLSPRARRRE